MYYNFQLESLFFELIQIAVGNCICLSQTLSAEEWQMLLLWLRSRCWWVFALLLLIFACFGCFATLGILRLCGELCLYVNPKG